jgi:N utilization substance protein B
MTETERSPARGSSIESRHRAREVALQMLYQCEVGRTPIALVLESFWSEVATDTDSDGALRTFASSLATGVVEQTAALDPVIAAAAEHWRVERMNVVDRLILRLAVYEFQHEADTPGKVIINEALELARSFSADESVRFINGILDAVLKTLGRE